MSFIWEFQLLFLWEEKKEDQIVFLLYAVFQVPLTQLLHHEKVKVRGLIFLVC